MRIQYKGLHSPQAISWIQWYINTEKSSYRRAGSDDRWNQTKKKNRYKLTLATSYNINTTVHQYIATIIQKSRIWLRWNQTKKKNNIHPANPRLPDPEPIPWLKKKKNSKSRHALPSRQIIALPVPATVFCSNLWAMRTQQSHYHGYQDYQSYKWWGCRKRLCIVWLITYEYKNNMRHYANGRKLVMI